MPRPIQMPNDRADPISRPLGLAMLIAILAGGCAGGDGINYTTAQAGLRCVDDSPGCISQRQSTLKALVSDPQRSWISQRPDAAAYASGVRLFAFKTKKKELSCAELQTGRQEADAGPAILRASGSGLSPAQVSRGVILAGEISRELGNEYNRRCRKT